MTSDKVVLVRLDGDVAVYSSEGGVNPYLCHDIQWILNSLSVEANAEKGIEAVTVTVKLSGADVVDIKLNGYSIGYSAIGNICKTLKIPQAEMIVRGEQPGLDVEKVKEDHKCPDLEILKQFGEIE
jgi:hypothetical protein